MLFCRRRPSSSRFHVLFFPRCFSAQPVEEIRSGHTHTFLTFLLFGEGVSAFQEIDKRHQENKLWTQIWKPYHRIVHKVCIAPSPKRPIASSLSQENILYIIITPQLSHMLWKLFIYFTFSESAQLTRFIAPTSRLHSTRLDLGLGLVIFLPWVWRLLCRRELQPLLIETTETVDLVQVRVLRLVLGRDLHTKKKRVRKRERINRIINSRCCLEEEFS